MASKKAKTSAAVALTASQTAARDQFMSVTSASEAQALRYLQAHGFGVDAAMGAFFDAGEAPAGSGSGSGSGGGGGGGGSGGGYSEARAAALFAQFEFHDKAGQPSGIMWDPEEPTRPGFKAFFGEALGLDLESDDMVLYLLSKCEQDQPKDKRDTTKRMAEPYQLKRVEFLLGCERLGCATAEAIRARIPALRKEMEEERCFTKYWDFLHRFFCEWRAKEGLQNSPTKETSIAVMQMVLGKPHRAQRFPHLALFVQFLEQAEAVKVIKRDDWQMMLHFGRAVAPDFSNFEGAMSWTTLYDDFKAFAEKQGVAKAAPDA